MGALAVCAVEQEPAASPNSVFYNLFLRYK